RNEIELAIRHAPRSIAPAAAGQAFRRGSAAGAQPSAMKTALPLALLALSACATVAEPPPAPTDGIARAALGERVYVDGPRVTPLQVLEDSRCPMNARCVW